MSRLRELTLEKFAIALQLTPLQRLVQHGREPATATYTIEFADGASVRVGTIKTLWSQAELARVLAVTIGHVPPPLEAGDWRAVIGALINHATDVQDITGESFKDTVSEWLTDYLDTGALDADKNGAAGQGLPFRDNGHVHVSASHLAKYIRREHSESTTLPELRQALRDIGFERQTIFYQRAKRRASRSYYVVEAGAVGPAEDDTS